MIDVTRWRSFLFVNVAVLALVLTFAFERSVRANQESAPCVERDIRSGNTAVLQMRTQKRGQCLIRIGPVEKGLAHRGYVLGSNGVFLVYNSFGEGSNTRSSGGRAYFIFPRKRMPSFEVLSTGDVDVRLASGGTVRFSASGSNILSMSGQEFSEDPKVRRNNKGGLEILNSNTLILDTGFQMGEGAYYFRNRTSVFRDQYGATCQVRNGEIFKYPRYDAFLGFETDQDLKSFLERRCPRLNLDSLTDATVKGLSADGAALPVYFEALPKSTGGAGTAF
jgi:hypothetical protein